MALEGRGKGAVMAKDYIKINPIEELLKAIEIVHGPGLAAVYRRLVGRWACLRCLDAVEWD